VKAVGLTSGDLRRVSATGLRPSQGDLIAAQKSAEGVVGGSAPLKARTVEVVSRTVVSRDAMRPEAQSNLNPRSGTRGEAPRAAAGEAETRAVVACLEHPAVAGPSMEGIVERENLKKALAQVKRNKGAAGVDGMTVEELPAYLKEHWLTIRAQLLDGTYKPQPVRRVEIPKASGGPAAARHPDRARPPHPAGGTAGVADRVGQDVLRDELRLPAARRIRRWQRRRSILRPGTPLSWTWTCGSTTTS
jgi:hypothetical protein